MKDKITCLLIDDDKDDQEIFILALRDINQVVECLTADDGAEALHKLRTDETFIPDYIFLDLNMPCMDGKECLSAIKKIKRLYHVPVIIYSTSSDPKDIVDTKNIGASNYITKQSSVSKLKKMLGQLFQGPVSFLFNR